MATWRSMCALAKGQPASPPYPCKAMMSDWAAEPAPRRSGRARRQRTSLPGQNLEEMLPCSKLTPGCSSVLRPQAASHGTASTPSSTPRRVMPPPVVTARGLFTIGTLLDSPPVAAIASKCSPHAQIAASTTPAAPRTRSVRGPSDLLDVAQRAVVGDLGQHRVRTPIPAYSESRSSAGAICRPSSDTVVEIRQTGVVVKSILVRTDEKPRLPNRFDCGRW